MKKDYSKIQEKVEEKAEQREKKKKPKMKVSGRSVFKLQKIMKKGIKA